MTAQLHEGLQALGNSASANRELYAQTGVNKALLEAFPNPFKVCNQNNTTGTVRIDAPEFSSLCPLTGFPDYAKIIVEYEPDELCVESKSYKLYLNSYRHQGEFHEQCIQRMCTDLVDLLNPKWIKIVGEFMPRGGIAFWPTATWTKPT